VVREGIGDRKKVPLSPETGLIKKMSGTWEAPTPPQPIYYQRRLVHRDDFLDLEEETTDSFNSTGLSFLD